MTRRALFRESTTGAIDDGAGGSIPTVPDPSGEPDGKVLETSSGALVYGTGGTGGDVAGDTHAATSKTTPVDNDEIPLADSATSYSLKKLLWSNLKATLKTYTDTLYDATGAAAAAQAASQPLDSDLTAIAGLDASTSGAIASDGAGWIKKTYSQFKTALSLVKGDVGLGNVDNTADSAKSVATAAALTTARNIDGQSFDGSGNITVIAPGTHAATSKATPVDADELPLVDSAASNVLKKLTWANLKATIKAYTDTLYPSGSGTSTGTNTGDQTSVSGNAGTATKLAATKNIDGQAFDGSADITVIAPGTHAATSKATPVDADELPLVDSAASNVLKKLTWANLKATLKTYFDTLYAPSSTSGFAVFGDGSDGAVTFNGTSTLLGIVPSPSSAVNGVYTLTRDVFLADGSALNTGISIITNGYRIFCNGTFTNNGIIQWNGHTASGTNNSTAGTALTNASSSINVSSGATAPGTAGGAGGTAAGTQAAAQTQGGLGGGGGKGGTGTGGAGGAARSALALAVNQGSLRSIPTAVTLITLNVAASNAVWSVMNGGCGGSGGGGDTTNAGGGGGGGGGIVGVYVKTFAGTGVIQARGGAGGTPTTGNCGGGGGGGGGLVVVISSSVVAGAISGQTVDANGGAKGSPVGGGTDNAVAGSNGTVILLPN